MLRYWNDFRSKGGFGDGDSLPPDAHETRDLYVKAVNEVAELLGSRIRAEAFDRGGMHNPYIITLRDVVSGVDEYDDQFVKDDAWDLVFDALNDANDSLDDCIDTVVTVDEAYYDQIMATIRATIEADKRLAASDADDEPIPSATANRSAELIEDYRRLNVDPAEQEPENERWPIKSRPGEFDEPNAFDSAGNHWTELTDNPATNPPAAEQEPEHFDGIA